MNRTLVSCGSDSSAVRCAVRVRQACASATPSRLRPSGRSDRRTAARTWSSHEHATQTTCRMNACTSRFTGTGASREPVTRSSCWPVRQAGAGAVRRRSPGRRADHVADAVVVGVAERARPGLRVALVVPFGAVPLARAGDTAFIVVVSLESRAAMAAIVTQDWQWCERGSLTPPGSPGSRGYMRQGLPA